MEKLIWQSCFGSLVIKGKSKEQETVSPSYVINSIFIAQNLSQKSSSEPHMRVRPAVNGKC